MTDVVLRLYHHSGNNKAWRRTTVKEDLEVFFSRLKCVNGLLSKMSVWAYILETVHILSGVVFARRNVHETICFFRAMSFDNGLWR